MRYIALREQRQPTSPAQVDPHRLDGQEQRTLLRIQWTLVIEATGLGAVSGLICAIAELWADANLAPDPAGSWSSVLRYWGVLGASIGVVSLIEVLILYLESLKAVQMLARATGTRLVLDESDTRGSPMSAALVRAALELPNPPPSDYAIDPLREVTRWRAAAVGLLYKAKIGLTSFLVKMLLRRVLGRAALRAWLVFVGVPVTAFWNGVVAWSVVREARLRAIGPSAARRFGQLLELSRGGDGASEDERARAALIWRAVAATVVRTHHMHPNVAAFMTVLEAELGQPPEDDLDDTSVFLEQLAVAPVERQRVALRALAVAAILDGRVSGDERRLVDEVAAITGLPMPRRVLARLRANFVSGGPLQPSLLGAIASGEPAGHRQPAEPADRQGAAGRQRGRSVLGLSQSVGRPDPDTGRDGTAGPAVERAGAIRRSGDGRRLYGPVRCGRFPRRGGNDPAPGLIGNAGAPSRARLPPGRKSWFQGAIFRLRKP